MVIASRLTKRIFAAAVCAGILGGIATPADAADIGLTGHGSKHVWTSRIDGNWLDRCAYAGYYCLYAEYGYVYACPFDDRPVAYAHYRRRHR
jgi:hypothetical protein